MLLISLLKQKDRISIIEIQVKISLLNNVLIIDANKNGEKATDNIPIGVNLFFIHPFVI